MSMPDDREAILYAFALEPSHDRSTLERYLRRYPELAEDLIDLSSELRHENVQAHDGPVPDPGLESAWQEFVTCKPQGVACGDTVNPFASFKGTAFAILAKALDVPRSFLTPFRDGLVTASSIPQAFTQRFAEATGVPVESVRRYFARGEPETPALAFKSDVKPSHQGQMTFRELIQSTEMNDEQLRLLLRDCDADGRD